VLCREDHPGGIRELALERPPVNALDPRLIRKLREEIEAVGQDEVKALVLTSRLPSRFSGGLDIPALLELDRAGMAQVLEDFFALLKALAFLPCPSVAALNGHAPAGGAVLALHCDLVVLAEGDFRIGLNEVQVGLPLPASIHAVLARRVGLQAAERLAVRGLLVASAEAYRLGLVDELVPVDAVRERAFELAREFLSLPKQAMLRTRALARCDLQEQILALSPATQEAFLEDWFSKECQQALRAFVERLRAGRGRAGAAEIREET
jgi:enoyl-CoA hydratase/carnithine racemase